MTNTLRAQERDLIELFGFAPDDRSPTALLAKRDRTCPFVGGKCVKTNPDQSEIHGTCSVTNGSRQKAAGSEVIICPRRLYADRHAVLERAARLVWPEMSALIVGGDYDQLAIAANDEPSPVIGFGHGSGGEVRFNFSNGTLSLDWILQRYDNSSGTPKPVDFIGVEVQTIDIAGEHGDTWASYMSAEGSGRRNSVPDSGHVLNWAEVHQRIVPQLIRKGKLVASAPRCRGFFLITSDVVYQSVEDVIGTAPKKASFGEETMTAMTYSLGPHVPAGEIRAIAPKRTVHYRIDDVAQAFAASKDPQNLMGQSLDGSVARLLGLRALR